MQAQRYLGTAQTEPIYGMYAYGGYPGMVDKAQAEQTGARADSSVFGEIYEVDEECVRSLDKIECVDVDLFERRLVHLKELHLTRLPLFQATFDLMERKQAFAYIFKKSVAGCAECGSFWPRRN